MTATPNGCAHCGVPQRVHGTRIDDGIGVHVYAAPDAATVKERMKARREEHHAR